MKRRHATRAGTKRAKKPDVTRLEALGQLETKILRADSLMFLLATRLTALNDINDAPAELYALSVVADAASDLLQGMLDKVNALRGENPGGLPAAAAEGGA